MLVGALVAPLAAAGGVIVVANLLTGWALWFGIAFRLRLLFARKGSTHGIQRFPSLQQILHLSTIML